MANPLSIGAGTATQHNDAMESHAVAQVFPLGVPCSSTKPMTGHTLGAAGALEAAFCWLSLTHDNALAPHLWDGQPDPALPALQWVTPGQTLAASLQRCLCALREDIYDPARCAVCRMGQLSGWLCFIG